MKKLVSAILILLLLLSLTACQNNTNEQYLRIHIRANSNSETDQNVKYLVKETVVNFLAPKLAGAKTKEEAKQIVLTNKKEIEQAADGVLKQNGFNYGASAVVKKENFPTRVYDDVTLESGIYEALIVNLGDGTGDNWWCVVYPPLCFVGGELKEGEAIRYRSKLLEIIESFFNK